MPDFNVADGSVGTTPNDNSPLSLIKGYLPNTWFYAPRAARIATSKDKEQRPIFIVARNRIHEPNGQGLKTVGGIFAAQLELTVPIPTIETQNQWTEQIKRDWRIVPEGSNIFRFQPMRLRSGKMTILGVDQYVVDPSKLIDIPVSASSTIPVTLQLNALGADTFVAALKDKNTAMKLPLAVRLTFKYDMVVPNCHYKITADTKRVYDYFSVNAKARASYFGLVGGKADFSKTRQDLVNSGAIKIDQISPPDKLSNERIQQLETAIIDSWTKSTLKAVTNPPQNDPAVAPDPNGFFGGISVSMKDYKNVEKLNLSAEINYSQLAEETFDLSYVFGPQFANLNVSNYLLDVEDDNKLPIVINLCRDEAIYRYSGQFGYRKQDGTFVSNSITNVDGKEGAVLTGQIQFATKEPPPITTDVQLSVDWHDRNWEDRTEKTVLTNGDSGIAYTFSPGNRIARIKIMTNLELLEEGSISIISWRSRLPNFQGNVVKVYSGALYLVGQGQNGKFQTEMIEFPYHQGAEVEGKLIWDVMITKPDGTVITKSNEIPITQPALPLLSVVLLK
jgi:hypothetical protein